jgi:hypothetical protein
VDPVITQTPLVLVESLRLKVVASLAVEPKLALATEDEVLVVLQLLLELKELDGMVSEASVFL